MEEITNILNEHNLYSSEILLGRIDRAEEDINDNFNHILVSNFFITINSKNINFNKRNVWGFGVLGLSIRLWCSIIIGDLLTLSLLEIL